MVGTRTSDLKPPLSPVRGAVKKPGALKRASSSFLNLLGLLKEAAPDPDAPVFETVTYELPITDNAILRRIKLINRQSFQIRRGDDDVHEYEHGELHAFYRNSVLEGYNLIAKNEYEYMGKKRIAVKVGPSAVLPTSQGQRFVGATSQSSIQKIVLPELLRSWLPRLIAEESKPIDIIVVAGNDRYKELSEGLPDKYTLSDFTDEKLPPIEAEKCLQEELTKMLIEAAKSVYPDSVCVEMFLNGGVITSRWVPKDKPEGEVATICLMKGTKANLTYAAKFNKLGTKSPSVSPSGKGRGVKRPPSEASSSAGLDLAPPSPIKGGSPDGVPHPRASKKLKRELVWKGPDKAAASSPLAESGAHLFKPPRNTPLGGKRMEAPGSS